MSDYNNDDIKDTEDEQKYEDVCYMCRRPESKARRVRQDVCFIFRV